MSDGHSSRFDEDVLGYHENESDIHLHIGPPDTTGATQLLDQINQSIHATYRTEKDNLFTHAMSINRKGFMTIMVNVWGSWAPPEKSKASRNQFTWCELDAAR